MHFFNLYPLHILKLSSFLTSVLFAFIHLFYVLIGLLEVFLRWQQTLFSECSISVEMIRNGYHSRLAWITFYIYPSILPFFYPSFLASLLPSLLPSLLYFFPFFLASFLAFFLSFFLTSLLPYFSHHSIRSSLPSFILLHSLFFFNFLTSFSFFLRLKICFFCILGFWLILFLFLGVRPV